MTSRVGPTSSPSSCPVTIAAASLSLQCLAIVSTTGPSSCTVRIGAFWVCSSSFWAAAAKLRGAAAAILDAWLLGCLCRGRGEGMRRPMGVMLCSNAH